MVMGATTGRYFTYLVWVAAIFSIGVYIFTSGFLLQRQVLPNQSNCKDRRCSQPPTVFKRAIIVVIDALKYEFCVYNSSLAGSGSRRLRNARQQAAGYHVNRLPVIHELTRPDPDTGQIHGKLFRFLADPPTTTMQRLKGLTTGSLPTFIDVSSNFASYKIEEDSFINQLNLANKSIYFSGDDTWLSLYPDSFRRADPQPSFDVWDLDSVDNKVRKFLYTELGSKAWDVMIGHFLGVDHAGHKFGPNHPEMGRKLGEMDGVIRHLANNLPKDTVLFVFGDHGMTSSGDHGGDSTPEVEAGLFVYGSRLGFRMARGETPAVAQVDLVPTLSLLLGIPVPFSNLGMIIEDLFIPTMLIKDDDKSHARVTSFSQDNLLKFRTSYMKSNVDQVHRYLTAYLAAGGHFPERLNSKVRKLAAEVINRPGALSPRESAELYARCREFLTAAKQMCQAVWVNFDDQAILIGLTVVVLHSSVLALILCKPQTRLLSTLISGSLLIVLGASILMGSLFGASITVLADSVLGLADQLPSMAQLIVYAVAFTSVLGNGMCVLWKLRYCISEMLAELRSSLSFEHCLSAGLYFAIAFSVVSNSFVVNESRVLCFALVSLLLVHLVLHSRGSRIITLVILISVGLIRLGMLYVRCREEDGPTCQLSQFHKPLSTLDNETGFYRNWRYFFTLLSLFILCVIVHGSLSSAGNLNGISCSVLTAKYLPWVVSVLMGSYWALQAFPSPLLVSSLLLPAHHNLLAQLVFGLTALGTGVLVFRPRLVYFQTKRGPGRLISRQDNIPSYFNFIKENWRTAMERSSPAVPLGYGLGSCLSAPFYSVTTFLVLISMLMAGDGQCPAVLIQFLLMISILVISAHSRLKQMSGVAGLLRVPLPHLVAWALLDALSFFTSGHQATFPHIQWSAAFVGMEGSQIAGESYSGHILPGLLVGWNTFSASLLAAFGLPLLLLAPAPLYLLLPALRSSRANQTQANGAGALLNHNVYSEVEKGEAVLLDKPLDTHSSLVILILQFILLKSIRLACCMLAAAILRRHLMVWKIFAPRFIFETVGFFVSLAGLLAGYLVFIRIYRVVSLQLDKFKIS